MHSTSGGLPADLVSSRPNSTKIETAIGKDHGRESTAGAGIDDADTVLIAVTEGGRAGGHELRDIADATPQLLKLVGDVLVHGSDGRRWRAARHGFERTSRGSSPATSSTMGRDPVGARL